MLVRLMDYSNRNEGVSDLGASHRAARHRRTKREVGARSSPTIQRRVRAVDLFCGVGGLTHGLRSRGIGVVAGYDVDPSCRYAYETNNDGAAFVQADIRELSYSDIEHHYRDADVTVMVGCAPCQPFSAHTRRNKGRHDDCSLLDQFSRLVQEGGPDIVSIENVPGLARHDAFAKFTRRLHDLEYDVAYEVLCCGDYGVPQRRRRLVLLASRLCNVSIPQRRAATPAIDGFIRGLPPVASGQSHPLDSAHATLPLSDLNYRRIMQSKPGGSWKDWDEDLISACHSKAHYPAPYGRMRWKAPAPTITTQFCYYSTGRFGHPEQHRTISVREAALLQTFPPAYALIDPDDTLPIHKIARHVGNAVPVKLAEAIGDAILEAARVQ